MRPLICTVITALTLTGCVTENTYVGSKKPVVENKINKKEAARTRISLALKYLAAGDSTQAKYNLERAAKFDPSLPEVHYSMAYYYQQVGEPELAKKHYEIALDIAPNDANTLNNYGAFLCDIGDYDGATDKLLRAINVPSYLRVAQSYENLALCAIEFDKFEAAESYLESAIKHNAQSASSLINLAALSYAKSDLYQAKNVLKRYERTGRVSSRSLLLSYLIENRMGRVENARNHAKTIVQTYPSSVEARIVRQQKFASSEFERLREQYRKSQLNKLQESSNEGRIVAKPKIKIVKKKSPNKVHVPTLKVASKNQPITPVQEVTNSTEQVQQVIDELTAQTQQQAQQPVNNANSQTLDEAASLPVDAPSPSSEQATPPESETATQVAKTTAEAKEVESEIVEPVVEAAQETAAQEKAAQQTATQTQDAATSGEAQLQETLTAAKKSDSAELALLAELAAEQQAEQKSEKKPEQTTDDTAPTADEVKADSPPVTAQTASEEGNVSELTVPYYIIKDGETLFRVSQRYNIRLSTLRKWNNLNKDSVIVAGSKIYVNNPNIYHDVQQGETLSDIATKYNISLDKLLQWNGLSATSQLSTAQRILIVDPENYQL